MAQKRIDFFGQVTPTALDTSQADVFRSLAGLASTVGGIAFEQGARIATEEGAAAGRAAGQTGAVEEKGSFTFYDRAYNEEALLAYRARVARDTKETLNRLSNEHENDPEAFRQSANAYRIGVLNDMPELFQPVIGGDILDSITNIGTTLENKYHAAQKRQNMADITAQVLDLEDDILIASRNGDAETLASLQAKRKGILDKGVSAGLVDPVSVAKQSEGLDNRIAVNDAAGKIERIFSGAGTLEDKLAQTNQLVNDVREKYGELDPQQKDALLSTLEATVAEKIKVATQLTAEQQREIADRAIKLELEAQYSLRPASEIMADTVSMWQAGELTNAQYKGIQSNIIKNQQEAAEQAQDYTKVSQRIAGDDSILLSQKEVDKYYEDVALPQIEEMPQEQKSAVLANIVVATGVMPAKLKQRISNGLRSRDISMIKESADIIDRLDSVRGIDSGVSASDRAFASIVNNMTGVMAPEEAIDYATQLTDPRNKERVEMREAQIKEEEYQEEYQEWIEDEFDNLDSESLGRMKNEFQSLFETHFKAGMDETEAKSKAIQLIGRNWKYSESSDRVMKFPPEEYYPINGGAIKQQLGEYVSKNFGFSESVGRSFLVSDNETARMARHGQPDYLVMVQTEDGMLQTLSAVDPEDGKSKFIRWSPDVASEREKVKKENVSKGLERRGSLRIRDLKAHKLIGDIKMVGL